MSQSVTSVVARAPRARTESSRPARDLRVVSSADGQGSPWFAVACVLLLLAGLGAVLGLNTAMAQDSFAVGKLEARSAELSDTQESLTHEIDSVSAPQHLAERANGLGMVPADSPAFIDLDKGRVLGVATTAERPAGHTVDASASPTVDEPQGTSRPEASASKKKSSSSSTSSSKRSSSTRSSSTATPKASARR